MEHILHLIGFCPDHIQHINFMDYIAPFHEQLGILFRKFRFKR